MPEMVLGYEPTRWYWIVAGDELRLWSSALPGYVESEDGGYLAWRSGGGVPTRIVSEEDLDAVLRAAGLADRSPLRIAADVIAERERRLALGFDYDFGDARGVHRIGTTPQDMAGWREVTDLANARLAGGDAATPIQIVTDTGPAEVTPAEWQAVLRAGGNWRQPLWGASFILQSMDPIPADFAADGYWQAP